MTTRGRSRIHSKSGDTRLLPHLARYQRKKATAPQAIALPIWTKILGGFGMMGFWLGSMHWLPGLAKGDQMDLGFKLFCLCQIPLLWCWIKAQARQMRRMGQTEADTDS